MSQYLHECINLDEKSNKVKLNLVEYYEKKLSSNDSSEAHQLNILDRTILNVLNVEINYNINNNMQYRYELVAETNARTNQ